jgi:replicative DNA helicase
MELYAIEAEESLLGAILLDPNAIDRVADLDAAIFFVTAHREIFRAAIALHFSGKPVDLVSLAAELSSAGKLDKVGGRPKLAHLAAIGITSANVDFYADLIAEKHLRRSLKSCAANLAEISEDNEEIGEVLNRAESEIFAITQQQKQDSAVISISDIVTQEFEEIADKLENKEPTGYLSGFEEFDRLTDGLQLGDLIILAGRPSMGKTALAIDLSFSIARNYKKPVIFFSLEMSKEQLERRILSAEAEIETSRLRAGNISSQEWQNLTTAIASISQVPLLIDDSGNPSVNEIRSRCRKVAIENDGVGLVVIDYLQLMEGPGENRVQELSRISRRLKSLARELKCPVLALSQLSRAVEARNNKRPMMSDLRESGALEQDADTIVMAYRDEYYNPDTEEPGIAEIAIAKQRNNPTGLIKLLFEKEYTRFRNLKSL